MEKMLRECFIKHKLRNKQSLITIAATSNQVRQPLTAQLSNSSGFLLKPNHAYTINKTHQTIISTRIHSYTRFILPLMGIGAKRVSTRNCRESGQADLLNRFTATHRSSSSFPLYTTLGAFSPCSETMFSDENPEVAALSWFKLNSLNTGNESSLLLPFSVYHNSHKPKSNYHEWTKLIETMFFRIFWI